MWGMTLLVHPVLRDLELGASSEPLSRPHLPMHVSSGPSLDLLFIRLKPLLGNEHLYQEVELTPALQQ